MPGNDAIMRAVKLYGDKRVVVSKDLRDNTHRFVIGPHLNKAGLKHWKIALLADRMTSRDASRTTHTSFNDHEVNRPIPVTWDKRSQYNGSAGPISPLKKMRWSTMNEMKLLTIQRVAL